MQQNVSIRRPLLVCGGYVLVNIILDMPLEYGLTTRPRANTIIDTVTYLVDGTYRRWFWEVFLATAGGHDVEPSYSRPGNTFYISIPDRRWRGDRLRGPTGRAQARDRILVLYTTPWGGRG